MSLRHHPSVGCSLVAVSVVDVQSHLKQGVTPCLKQLTQCHLKTTHATSKPEQELNVPYN